MPADSTSPDAAAGNAPRRLYYFSGGFLTQKRVRRIITLAGYALKAGKPGAGDTIAVWGHTRYAARGQAVASRTGAGLLRVEDAFLRSVHPGRAGEPPIGLVMDSRGMHYDSTHGSDLEHILTTNPLDDTALLNRARGAMARIQAAHLSKYNAFDPQAPCPEPGYVLVIDQTLKDASVSHGGADTNTFREMLYYAQEDNPHARIVVKTHPETAQGFRAGYFGADIASDRITLLQDPVSPWALLEGAVAVYTVSSQMGFEAILAGHRPVVFGQPFYAGWGLSDDRAPAIKRRKRNLTKVQLFAAAMILYPVWYDPCRDRLATLEDAISALEAEVRSWREDHKGWAAAGMALWKRPHLQRFFGRYKRVVFRDRAKGRRRMIWAGKARTGNGAVRVEDGFLRSRGLGAELVPPLSLICDDLGIYYDPAQESRLERLIVERSVLRPDQEQRAEALIGRLQTLGLTKYNLGGGAPLLPEGHRVLVVGQVEDDASIRAGAGEIDTNLALLQAARAAHPDAVILYKPHPDVEAGLRRGKVPAEVLKGLADAVLPNTDPAALLSEVQEVWTMTSLLGFEALIRGLPVTTTGAPFYAGWGLTRDLGMIPKRRNARPGLTGLVHAALIDYPRYLDPISRRPCPVEVAVERLTGGPVPHPGWLNRVASKLQGAYASIAGPRRRG